MRTLLLTDLHFMDRNFGLLEAQTKCIKKICKEEKPDEVIFMGDLMMNRRPSPSVLLALKSVIDFLVTSGSAIYILRGNHDSETKADDGISALSLFDSIISNVKVITHIWIDDFSKRVFIPHYEDEKIIKEALRTAPEGYEVFGHFGYAGCLNSAGDLDFSISFSEFRNPTYLGHIHKFNRKRIETEGEVEEVVILGTPYTTNFGECEKGNWYAILTDGDAEYKKITHGPRHLAIRYKDLASPEVIDYVNDNNYYTLLRVLRDRDDEDLKLDAIDVDKLDIIWTPTTEDVIKDTAAYNPGTELFSINEVILEDYIKSVETDLTNDQIMEGYNLIKNED